MLTDYEVEQVFLSRKGPWTEAQLVLVSVVGAPYREAFPVRAADLTSAARTLGRLLASRGDVASVARTRLRVRRGGDLADDPELLSVLKEAFRQARRA